MKSIIEELWNGERGPQDTLVNNNPHYKKLQQLQSRNKTELLESLSEDQKEKLEVAPLAYMRGRTLDDSFIILDEAQNTSCEQMKMFLTRMGFNSKMVITGDVTQIDLPADKMSGLKQAVRVLKDVEGIGICELTDQDVVRHVMVQRIIKAYADYEAARNEKRKK